MRSVTYSIGALRDGYIVGPEGDFHWTAPEEKVFRFELNRATDAVGR